MKCCDVCMDNPSLFFPCQGVDDGFCPMLDGAEPCVGCSFWDNDLQGCTHSLTSTAGFIPRTCPLMEEDA